MAGFGGFGGFGSSQNQNQTTSAFGGFGQTATSGFGTSTNTPAAGTFGSGGSTGGLFGSNNPSSGFGGFGANNSNSSTPFGQSKPAFGSTSTGGSLFGANNTTTSNSAFGGFGSGGGGAFGSTGSTTFGASAKPAFGGGTSGGLFGNTGNTGNTSTFGSNTGSTAFGASTTTSSPFASNQPNNGTANVPWVATNEKEQNSAATSAYQSISAMPPYVKFSHEELRCVDYAQGRKYGNANQQAGAFGTSSGFGGFGSTTPSSGFGATNNTASGGLFGNSNPTTSSAFGGSQNATSGFGATSSGGLFGAKPATGSLFGNAAATSAPSTGGLFGTSSGGFGASGTSNTFGATNSNTGFGQSQNKPLFGASPANTGFGGGSTGSTSLFGNNNTSSSGGFGSTQPSTGSGFSFGQQNNQTPQAQNQTGGGLFGGAFSTNQPKPGGLFGSTTPSSGGLFGAQQPQAQQQSGGLFGGSNNQQSGGLFGAKPATNNLFGTPNNNSSSGGLFGNTAQQQQPSGGLFGASNTNNQTTGAGLFGAKPTTTPGLGSLFGQPQQPTTTGGTSLFGNSQTQQQGLLGSSILGGSQQQMQQSQQNHLVASLTDNPYGNIQLFSNLATPTQSLGPIATPLSSSQKGKKQAVIPHYRAVPHASSRLITPQRRPQGYGFSYSNYNSPLSPSSNASPLGLGTSLLGGSSLGRSLGKSLSTSNLRHSYSAQDSILAPGAFSTASKSGPGSMKKLNIHRNLGQRRSLFSTDSAAPNPSKRVSFENGTAPVVSESSALVPVAREESPVTVVASPPIMSNGSTGRELAVVPESASEVPHEVTDLESQNRKAVLLRQNQQLGDYYSEPPMEELQKMSAHQRSCIERLKVGRVGAGWIEFSKADLTDIPLDQLFGQVIRLELRQATVFGDNSPIRTQPRGTGLNVPAIISLENSWPPKPNPAKPAAKDMKALIERHVKLLKRAKGTTFISYDEMSGRWTFEVKHFTTYGLEYDEEEAVTKTIQHDEYMDDMSEEYETGPMLDLVESPASSQGSSINDTFDFKKNNSKQLPGQFDDIFPEDVSYQDGANTRNDHDMMDAMVPYTNDAVNVDPGFIEEQYLPFDEDADINDAVAANPPTPKLNELILAPDWTEHLQQTVSPVKRDRQALRDHTEDEGALGDVHEPVADVLIANKGFENTLDIMNSLFQNNDATGRSQAFEMAVNIAPGPGPVGDEQEAVIQSVEESDPSRFDKFETKESLVPQTIEVQQTLTSVATNEEDAVPFAQINHPICLSELAAAATSETVAEVHEKQTWQLASILFDKMSAPVSPGQNREARQSAIRRHNLSHFWRDLLQQDLTQAVQSSKTAEEKALHYLIGGNAVQACAVLTSAKDFQLAIALSQLPGDDSFKQTMSDQINHWVKRNDWTEMSDEVRTLYEICCGQVCEVRGANGPGPENKVSSFRISERFQLNWKQAFALRLWYGSSPNSDIAAAVVRFRNELDDAYEGSQPVPWFWGTAEELAEDSYDPAGGSNEDIQWGLLKLYADNLRDERLQEIDIRETFDPMNVSGDSLDVRLSFQLFNAIQGTGIVYRDDHASIALADALAQRYAQALLSQISKHPSHLVTAVWTLLHLSDSEARRCQVQDVLNENAALVRPGGDICGRLTSKSAGGLWIPFEWVCEALARHAEAVLGDRIEQASWLIQGGQVQLAHQVFCEHIGPAAVISMAHDAMLGVLKLLKQTDVKGITNFDRGAGLYDNYATLLEHEATTKKGQGNEVGKLAARLAKTLEALTGEVHNQDMGCEGKIAIKLMAEHVAEYLRHEEVTNKEKLACLPLTETGYLKQTMGMSLGFYHSLMLQG